MWWMLALIVVVLVHQWIPQARWLLVHMVTLGLITTSIMVWGQHFTEALLKTRMAAESRARQVARSYLLTTGVVVTIAGMLPGWPWLVLLGAVMVSATLVWYAASLGLQVKAAIAPRFEFTVKAYIGAASLLPVGAGIGVALAFGPGEPWQGRLLLAHQVVNVLGFVGITVSGTLLTLWPTVLRTRIELPLARRAAAGLLGMFGGVLGAVAGALVGSTLLGVSFLGVYLVSFLWLAAALVRVAVRSARQERQVPLPRFPMLSIAAGVLWFALTLLALLATWWRSGGELLPSSLLAADIQQFTVPFVAGFLLQVLLGAMSYLLPVTMGGGPRVLKASLAIMSRFAVPRVAAYNLAVALLVLAPAGGAGADALFSALTLGTARAADFGSLSRVLVALLSFAVLVCFVVLMILMVRSSLRLRHEPLPTPGIGAPTGGAVPVGPPTTGSAPTGASAGSVPVGRSSATGSGGAAAARPVDRRALTGALIGLGSVLGVTALGGSLDRRDAAVDAETGTPRAPQGPVAPTGETTTIAVSMAEMRFTPDVLEVPAGNSLVIELHNDDEHDVHDLVLASGVGSGRLLPGETATVDAGVIGHDVDGWCSIVGHRAMGMVLQVTVIGGSSSPGDAGAPAAAVDDLTRVPLDLQAFSGAEHAVRDARLPESSGAAQRLTLEITEVAAEIAPGVVMDAMTFGGTVPGPVIRSELGAGLTVDLVNRGSMGHSLDLHAGRVSPDGVMRTILPGESLEYAITTDHAGAWLYHCATIPMSVHMAAGMMGALIVPPSDLAAADREYVLVQSEHYLVPPGAPGAEAAMHEGALPVSSAKIAAERPDATVFNGHATQYVQEPLVAKVGERVRLWVVAGGPSRGISFHVVGAVFDTVFAEGEYLLRPDSETAGGSQVLDLSAAQGGFVEMVFEEPGTYTAVNHSVVEMERGARALIRVSA